MGGSAYYTPPSPVISSAVPFSQLEPEASSIEKYISSAISLSILTTFCAPAGQPEPAALTPPSHRNDQRQQQPSQFRTVTWQRRRRLV